jgi:hypothetical protein
MTLRKKLPARPAPARLTPADAPRGLRPSAHRVLLPTIAAVHLTMACLGCGRDRAHARDAERSLVTITADPQAKPHVEVAAASEPRARANEATPSLPGLAIHGELEAPGPLPAKLVRTPPAPPPPTGPVAPPPPAYHPPAVMGTVGPPVAVPALPPATSAPPRPVTAAPGVPGAPPAP